MRFSSTPPNTTPPVRRKTTAIDRVGSEDDDTPGPVVEEPAGGDTGVGLRAPVSPIAIAFRHENQPVGHRNAQLIHLTGRSLVEEIGVDRERQPGGVVNACFGVRTKN
jgi:hypothetical protein